RLSARPPAAAAAPATTHVLGSVAIRSSGIALLRPPHFDVIMRFMVATVLLFMLLLLSRCRRRRKSGPTHRQRFASGASRRVLPQAVWALRMHAVCHPAAPS